MLFCCLIQCDKLCGKGKQSREVVCYKKIDGEIEVIDDSICYDEKPEAQRECINQPCDGVDWLTSEWTAVSCLFTADIQIYLLR